MVRSNRVHGCPRIISQIKSKIIKMELSLSGNSLKTFSRAINSLTRIGTELILQASRSQLVFHTLNSSRSAYQSITFKSDFFDSYNLKIANNSSIASDLIQCSVLLKSVCAILRTPISNIDRLSAVLTEVDSPKLQWTLQCLNGVKKTYWISCNVEPDIQHLSLDRAKFPSNLVVRPRDLTRLLSNFQSSLHEITIIATDPSAAPSDASGEIGGKAVELKSYIDPTKDYSDSALHTQLWIDPAEEFVQYVHVGDPVDVTFGVKELKAFLAFCEGCEVDIHLFFEKAGEPILLAPKFSVDVGSYSDFDTTLVLATMLVSQLSEAINSVQPPANSVPHAQDAPRKPTQSENSKPGSHPAGSEHPSSDHTKIWSDLSGSAAKSNGRTRDRQIQNEGNRISSTHNDVQMHDTMNSSMAQLLRDKAPNTRQPVETDRPNELQDRLGTNGNPHSQHHPSNWVGDDDEDEDEDDDGELYVQSTPQYDD